MRRKRKFNLHSYYHVIMRGNNRQPIFKTKEDMFELKRAFLHVHADYPFKLPSKRKRRWWSGWSYIRIVRFRCTGMTPYPLSLF